MADLVGRRSVEIAASPERCFAVAADIDRVPEWHGAMTEVDVLEHVGHALLVWRCLSGRMGVRSARVAGGLGPVADRSARDG
jgi:Polyketide cyclase / dehydrase and lipid transport